MTSAAPCRQYDQILSGDVHIKKIKHGKYKMTYLNELKSKSSNLLVYQTWSEKYPELNTDREVLYVNLNKWIRKNFINAGNPPVPYQPTCAMELDDGACPIHHKSHDDDDCKRRHHKSHDDDDDCKRRHHKSHDDHDCIHVFVITDAKIKHRHGRDYAVFYLSTITPPSNSDKKLEKKLKLITKIPRGEFKNVRFDIDDDLDCNAFA